MRQPSAHTSADVCLILEGTYPYVVGGVSTWTHELIKRHSNLRFHLISLLPRADKAEIRYSLPANVQGLTTVHLQRLPKHGGISNAKAASLFTTLRKPLSAMTTSTASLKTFHDIIDTLGAYRGMLDESAMLNSEAAWQLVTNMYEEHFSESSMRDYFWSWRALMSSLYSILNVNLPDARCFHALSTGYGGLLAARAHIETERPVIVTEHGIYTNERRIEIASAKWLSEHVSTALTITRTRQDLRDLWIDTFANYSRICYEAATHIVTLHSGNQIAQLADGAHPVKMSIIPNGIDTQRYGAIVPKPHPRPTIALIGRVSPIKDVKNFIRAVHNIRQSIPDLKALIMGPLDESPEYVEECRALVEYLALRHTVTFTGSVNIEDYLPEIDLLVLSSISEVQPLVILEAGACGIPAVVTDVGGCREMVEGRDDEQPRLKPGGLVVPLADSQRLAEAVTSLLKNDALYRECSHAMRTRVNSYYSKEMQYDAYSLLYRSCM